MGGDDQDVASARLTQLQAQGGGATIGITTLDGASFSITGLTADTRIGDVVRRIERQTQVSAADLRLSIVLFKAKGARMQSQSQTGVQPNQSSPLSRLAHEAKPP